jgi:frataxin-like iron-binding protein CyaY
MLRTSFLFLMLACLLSNPSLARPPYRQGDWISYSDFRYVTSIAISPKYVFFGTTQGITRYNRYTQSWDYPFTTSTGLLDSWVEDLAYDPSRGELWVKTKEGVCGYQPAFEDWIYGGSFPENLALSRRGKFESLYFFPPFGYHYFPEGYIADDHLREFPINAWLKDDWDNLWLGTWGLNAGVGSYRTHQLKLFKYGLMGGNVEAILKDGDKTWFGGKGGYWGSSGITVYDRQAGEWRYFEPNYTDGLLSDEVTCFAASSTYVWVGTTQGLSHYNKRTGRWSYYTTFDGLPSDHVTDLDVDDSLLWIGTSSGMGQLSFPDDTSLTLVNMGLNLKWIYDVEIGKDMVWVGTEEGLYGWDKHRRKWVKFSSAQAPILGEVTAISLWDDEVWLGTPHTISVFRKSTRSWKTLNPPLYQSGGFILCLAVDKTSVWAGTPSGAFKYNRQGDSWKIYTTNDGLLDNMVQSIAIEEDYIWFGTRLGATRFYWNSPYRID